VFVQIFVPTFSLPLCILSGVNGWTLFIVFGSWAILLVLAVLSYRFSKARSDD
jgi:hypothetical protein